MIHYDSLLQNAADIITKYNSCFVTNCDGSLLQNVSGFYYKMGQLLQNAMILLQNASVISKCDVDYKLR